ncbi:MAG: contractile injection system tape measure protein [Pseudomonadota bacterium]
MTPEPHRIGRIALRASVGDADTALALRPRLETLAWRLMPPVLEQVCEALGPKDAQLKLGRIDLDLGAVRPDHLEQDALAALEHALGEALGEALHRARAMPSDAARLVDPATARLQRFTTWLRTGTAPWAPAGKRLDPSAMLATLLAEQPDALVALLRRHARSDHVLERLVVQIGVAGLRDLLATLAPADAAAILALIADIILAHRARPVPPLDRLTEPALERLLWIATLELLLRDDGTRFNRRRFLAHLLSREATRLGVDYVALLRLLGDTAVSTRERIGFRTEFPQLLVELLAEAGDAPATSDERAPPSATTDLAAALVAARDGDFVALLALVRQLADDRPGLQALVHRLDDALFAGLVRRLEPAAADTILALLDEIEQSERVAPQPLFAADVQPVLRWLTLTYLLHDPGTQFNRRRFVAHLLEQEARRAGVAYAELVRLLAEASARVAARTGSRASLPAVLDELFDEIAATENLLLPEEEAHALASARAGDVAALLALLRAGQRTALWRHIDDALFARLIAALKPASADAVAADLATLAALHRTTPLLARTAPEFARLLCHLALADLLALTGRFQRRAWLSRLLRALAGAAGISEPTMRARVAAALRAVPSVTPDALAAVLAPELAGAGTADDAAAALRRAAAEPGALDRLAVELASRDRQRLLATLDAVHTDAVAEQLAALSRLHAVAALAPLDAAGFERLVWTLAVAWLARTAGARFDPQALARHLIDGLAHAADAPAEQIAARIRHAARGLDGTPLPAALKTILPAPSRSGDADLRQRIELFLRTGRPPEAGEELPDIAASDAPWLAALLRRIARATPADIPGLAMRLQSWLLPEEILACLAPDLPVDAVPTDASALLAGLLRGETIEPGEVTGRGGARFDDLALLAHWLDHGSVPWWSASRGAPLDLLAGLATRSDADLAWLFAGATRDAVVERLRRAILPLDAVARRRLFERLAPWAVRRGGPLAPLLAGRDAAGRLDIMLRAAATALDGAEIDLAALAAPPPAAAAPPPPVAGPGTAEEFDLTRLLAWLDGASTAASDGALFARWFAQALDRGEPGLVAHLRDRRGSATARGRWVAILPPEALGRLIHLYAPRAARGWIEAAMLLAAAHRRTAPFGARRLDPARLWALLLDLAAAPDRDVRRGIERLVTGLADGAASLAPLRVEAARLAQAAGDAALAIALSRPPSAKAIAKKAPAADPPATTESEEPPLTEDGEPIFIANAGLVLLAPYLPALLDRLGVLTSDAEGKQHIDGIDAMSRAVHLLQYMADQRLDAPEHELVLNKLLCGLPTAQPVLPSFAAEPADLELCDGLLGAVIANWPIIAGTSIEGLRETFLQRDGRLRHEEDTWRLQVQRKGVDVLVDRVPWSFATIFHRWMPQPLQVTW